MKLVSIGEATADFYPQHQQTFVGGISLNYAVHAKRCGAATVSLVSCVGTDAYGQQIVERLKSEGIDHSHVTAIEGKTAYCEIIVIEDRCRPGSIIGGVGDGLRFVNSECRCEPDTGAMVVGNRSAAADFVPDFGRFL